MFNVKRFDCTVEFFLSCMKAMIMISKKMFTSSSSVVAPPFFVSKGRAEDDLSSLSTESRECAFFEL